ncbi:hypothetical protein AAKU67_002372 [Oxalobacteraceae bacterium GrIS 2.11]
MKTDTLPSIRVEPEFREEIESVLAVGEILSSFIEGAARREAYYRKFHGEFLARGRVSLASARETGKTISAHVVIGDLDKIIDTKFGPNGTRVR